MKKKVLMYAGIAAAIILVIIFISILSTGSFTISQTISIDPIPDHTTGDLVTITGTTNYPAGSRLVLDILAAMPADGRDAHVAATDAFIVRGQGMRNRWSGALDTTTLPPGDYLVKAYWMDESKATDAGRKNPLASSWMRLGNATGDTVHNAPQLMNHTLAFITVNPPVTIIRGEKILVSGTTNLPPDTELLYTIVQQSGKSVFTVDPKTKKQELKGGFTRSGLIDLVPGENGVSRWSFAVDSTEFIPDHYDITVTPLNASAGSGEIAGSRGTGSLLILESDRDRLTIATPDTGPCQSITIDALPLGIVQKKYTITGTSTLPPGTQLLMEILPAEYEFNVNPDPTKTGGIMSGAIGTVDVIQGKGARNIWSVDIDLSSFRPEKYNINMSDTRVDPRTNTRLFGNAYCSVKFNVTG